MRKIVNHLAQKLQLGLFLIIPLILMIYGCARYATEEEIFEMKKLEQEVLSLEREVKELKEKQIEMTKYKFKLLKELENCDHFKKLNDSDN